MLRPNLAAEHPVTDIRHWAPRRTLVAATINELVRYTSQHPTAPHTVLSFEKIIAALDTAGQNVVLDADDLTLRSRIKASYEAREWRIEGMIARACPRCAAQPWTGAARQDLARGPLVNSCRTGTVPASRLRSVRRSAVGSTHCRLENVARRTSAR